MQTFSSDTPGSHSEEPPMFPVTVTIHDPSQLASVVVEG
jgi:hypothetical protein